MFNLNDIELLKLINKGLCVYVLICGNEYKIVKGGDGSLLHIKSPFDDSVRPLNYSTQYSITIR